MKVETYCPDPQESQGNEEPCEQGSYVDDYVEDPNLDSIDETIREVIAQCTPIVVNID